MTCTQAFRAARTPSLISSTNKTIARSKTGRVFTYLHHTNHTQIPITIRHFRQYPQFINKRPSSELFSLQRTFAFHNTQVIRHIHSSLRLFADIDQELSKFLEHIDDIGSTNKSQSWYTSWLPSFLRGKPTPAIAMETVSSVTSFANQFYNDHTELTPITNRKRLMLYRDVNKQTGDVRIEKILNYWNKYKNKNHVLSEESSTWKKVHDTVERVRQANIEETKDHNFQVHVINTTTGRESLGRRNNNTIHMAESSACSLSDNIIISERMVHESDDDTLAFILAHEMAHLILNHSAERFAYIYYWMLSSYHCANILGNQLYLEEDQQKEWLKTFTQKREPLPDVETEADTVSMILMSKACYHPSKATELMQRWKDDVSTTPCGNFYKGAGVTGEQEKEEIVRLRKTLTDPMRIFVKQLVPPTMGLVKYNTQVRLQNTLDRMKEMEELYRQATTRT